MHIVTERDPDSGALFARNPYARLKPGRIVFAQVSEPRHTVTGTRAEFIGRNGSPADPAALHRTRLSGKTGAGLDPCAALHAEIALADGQEREVAFPFGSGRDLPDARVLVTRFRGALDTAALERAIQTVMQRHEVLRTGFIAVNGTPVTDMADVSQAVASRKVGEKITVTVLRDGKEKTVTLTLKDRPADVGPG
jgi:cellobiose phosphorylase